jgi:hypothetical protein
MAEHRARRREPAPRLRLSAAQKDRFLEVLGQTGNRRFAAEAIGVEPRLMDQRRAYDKLLDRQWRAALAQADRRLSGASGPLDCIGGALNVIKRGAGGRLQLVACGPKRWTRAVDDRFFAALSTCGNIAAAARSVGFSTSCIAQRRRQWPDFARRMEEALEEAEMVIEFRLATMGSIASDLDCRVAGAPRNDGEGAAMAAPFDRDFALRFLRWREEKRRGGGRRGRVAAPPGIEEVTERIVRRVQAIKRHRVSSPPSKGGD